MAGGATRRAVRGGRPRSPDFGIMKEAVDANVQPKQTALVLGQGQSRSRAVQPPVLGAVDSQGKHFVRVEVCVKALRARRRHVEVRVYGAVKDRLQVAAQGRNSCRPA